MLTINSASRSKRQSPIYRGISRRKYKNHTWCLLAVSKSLKENEVAFTTLILHTKNDTSTSSVYISIFTFYQEEESMF